MKSRCLISRTRLVQINFWFGNEIYIWEIGVVGRSLEYLTVLIHKLNCEEETALVPQTTMEVIHQIWTVATCQYNICYSQRMTVMRLPSK